MPLPTKDLVIVAISGVESQLFLVLFLMLRF